LASKSANEFWFVEQFLSRTLPDVCDLAQKRAIVAALLDASVPRPASTPAAAAAPVVAAPGSPSAAGPGLAAVRPMEHRVQILQKIVNPMVENVLQHKEGATFLTPVRWDTCTLSLAALTVFVTQDLISKLLAALPEGESSDPSGVTESAALELMRLCTSLLPFMQGYAAAPCAERRAAQAVCCRHSPATPQRLIKFAWMHLKSEDGLTKNWSYLFVSRCMEVRPLCFGGCPFPFG
jgi:hypothetical protein